MYAGASNIWKSVSYISYFEKSGIIQSTIVKNKVEWEIQTFQNITLGALTNNIL